MQSRCQPQHRRSARFAASDFAARVSDLAPASVFCQSGRVEPLRVIAERSRLSLALTVLMVLSNGCSLVRLPGVGGIASGRPQVGMASFYGKQHHGQRTASGEPFDANAMTAAHPSLPFGTRLEVTNLENGRTVIVRVNDRGPFIANRIVDLSYAAARALGVSQDGVARVRVQALQ
jgi:rare lipoprotein A